MNFTAKDVADLRAKTGCGMCGKMRTRMERKPSAIEIPSLTLKLFGNGGSRRSWRLIFARFWSTMGKRPRRLRAQTHRQGYAVTVICARGTPLTP